MKGKKGEYAKWIKAYLNSQGIFTGKEYSILYNRYKARCLKYTPQSYESFLNLCTFDKLRNKKGQEVTLDKPRPFNEEKWIKEQKKQWEEYKDRMERYRSDKIRNLSQVNEQKDKMPYLFKFALRCLTGKYPIECYPESLEEYREELLKLLSTN